MSNRFEVTKFRLKIGDLQTVLIQGWFHNNEREDVELQFYLDGELLVANEEKRSGIEILRKRFSSKTRINTEYYYWVHLPKDYMSKRQLVVYRIEGGEKHKVGTHKIADLKDNNAVYNSCIDLAEYNSYTHILEIKGWIVSRDKVQIDVADGDKQKISAKIVYKKRRDVWFEYPELNQENVYAYEIEIKNYAQNHIYLLTKIGDQINAKFLKVAVTPGARLMRSCREYPKKAVIYLRREGLAKTFRRTGVKLFRLPDDEYMIWLKKHMPSEKELKIQRSTEFAYMPKISIVIPLYKTPIKYLQELIISIKNQTYSNWELCLSDGSGPNSPLAEILKEYETEDSRIKVIYPEVSMQISDNTNCALKIATGEFIAFVDHDDLLAENALFENVKMINEHMDADMLYSDEDKTDMEEAIFFGAHFKPDFDKDLLYTTNYICHFCVVRKTIVDQVGYLNSDFDGAQDYDFVLRCVELTENIYHIPKIIYHWRAHQDSTAGDPLSKLYAFQAGEKAVQAHYNRMGIDAKVISTEFLGNYRSIYGCKDNPLVSIIIPNKDHTEDLDKCIQSIEKKSKYPNIEYIVVENNSKKPETFRYYETLKKKNERVKIIEWKGEFNYSAINNFGVKHAKGNYYLLLNNDTEIISETCIEELLGRCMREDVGVVGARLYYPDDTIQHAGVIIGLGGVAGHISVGMPRSMEGYFSRILCAQDYSAVTAACMMVKKSVYEAVGGLNEKLKVSYNDVDFCLRVNELGKRVVYNPYAELYHYESKSRGVDSDKKKTKRFEAEEKYMRLRWNEYFEHGDPYYNSNLSLTKSDYSLRENEKKKLLK